MLAQSPVATLFSHKKAANRIDPCRCRVRKLGDLYAPMSDDDEVNLPVTYASHFTMDAAFCARMRAAIARGLESAPIGVVTTPGTKNPKNVPTEPRLLGFSLVEMDV